VSTTGQTVENQKLELEAWAGRAGHKVVAVYADTGISGAKGRDRRPEFDRMLKDAVRRKFDMLAAWSVDRLGRSLPDLVNALKDLHVVAAALVQLEGQGGHPGSAGEHSPTTPRAPPTRGPIGAPRPLSTVDPRASALPRLPVPAAPWRACRGDDVPTGSRREGWTGTGERRNHPVSRSSGRVRRNRGRARTFKVSRGPPRFDGPAPSRPA
jgi:hypothetical protein